MFQKYCKILKIGKHSEKFQKTLWNCFDKWETNKLSQRDKCFAKVCGKFSNPTKGSFIQPYKKGYFSDDIK